MDVLESAGDDLRQATAIALGHILENDEPVQWADVSGQMAKSEWERLVQTELVVDGGSGYQFSDPEEVRDALSDSPSLLAIIEPSTEWTFFDKLSLSVSIVFIATFSRPDVREFIGRATGTVLDPIAQLFPFWLTLGIVGFITSLWGSLILWLRPVPSDISETSLLRLLTFSNNLRRFGEARHADDTEALERIEREQHEELVKEFSDISSLLKLELQSVGFILIVVIAFLQWSFWTVYNGSLIGDATVLLPLLGPKEWSELLVGPLPVWLMWYGLCSAIISVVIDRLSSAWSLYSNHEG